MFTATLTTKGQLTVPKAVRDALGLREGDQVVFLLEEERAYLYPVHVRGIKALRGVAAGLRPFPGRATEREAARVAAIAEALGHSEGSSA